MSNVRPLFADLHPSPVDADAQFDLFWQHYPRKVAKAHARAMWRRLSATERAAALAALPAHVAYWTARATPPEHIPHAGTWLNPSLTPRELYRAQGFPESYRIEFEHEGRPLPKYAQVRMCGNAVPPPVAAALVRANFAHERRMDTAARRIQLAPNHKRSIAFAPGAGAA